MVSLGEVITPLIKLKNSVSYTKLDKGSVLVKDEGRLPTGSFKARGLCMAVSMAKQFKLKHLAIPTNGNAGAATLGVYDGTNWKVVTMGATASAS